MRTTITMVINYLAILGAYTIAAPIALDNIRGAAEPSTTSASTKRTLVNITWNCVSTIFICAWVSVHPNVPPSGHWRALRRRMKTMFWAIVAPELILAWAVRQWCAAWEIMDEVNGTNEGLFTGFIRALKEVFKRGTSTDSDESESTRWTMEHGHLLAMGGINTVDPSIENIVKKDPRGPVLTIEQHRELTRSQDGALLNLKLRKISIEDIKDRSKGDFLSKLIAILQTTWFILQCIARGQQRLALTELELITLALASLNAVTYAFWWHKPLGVQEPIRIYFKVPEKDVHEQACSTSVESSEMSIHHFISQVVGRHVRDFASDIVEGYPGPWLCFPLVLLVLMPVVLPIFIFKTVICLLVPFPLGILLLLKILKTQPINEPPSMTRGLLAGRIVLALQKFRYRLTSYIAKISEFWIRKQLDKVDLSFSGFFIGWVLFLPMLFFLLLAITVLLFPFFTFLFLLSFIFTAVFGIITSNTVVPGAKHVPSFYSPSIKSDKYSRMIVFALFGVFFGGLHCVGWNFTYPSPLEQYLWRATSLAITVIPFIVAPIDYILENFELDKGWLRVIRLTLDFIMTILLFIYVPARLSLIAQALALLRQQPDTAFLAVDWTQYIPHIF